MNIKKIEKIVVWLAYAAFLTPLIFRPEVFIFPFVFPKLIWFRSVTLLLVGCYALLLATDWKKYVPKLNWITGSVLLFALSWIISTYVGVDAYRSIWDGHERMLGLFTFLHYIIFFFVLSATVKNPKDWRNLARVFLGIGITTLLIAVIQHFDPNFLYNNGGIRVTGTLGNPIYLGAFAFFICCLGTWLALSATEKWEKIFGYSAVFLGLLGIIYSESRGPFLGFVASILVFATVYGLGTKKKLVRQMVIGVYAFLILGTGLIFVFRASNFVVSLPIIGRLATISTAGNSLATNTRVMAWEIAIEGFKEKPLFGWGPNNYLYVFNAHYRPEFLQFGGWGETWFDNAHNIILNTLAVQGIFGLVVYLLIFGAAIWALLKAYREKRTDITFLAFGLAFLIGHLVQNIFVFENATSYLYFFFILAMIVNVTRTDEVAATSNQTVGAWPVGAVLLGISILIFTTNIRPMQANSQSLVAIQNIYASLTPVKRSIIPEIIKQYEGVNALGSPHIDDIRMDVGRTVDEQLPTILQSNGKEESLKLFNLAYSEIKKNRTLHPLDVRYHIQQAQLALTGARLSNDPNYVTDAREAMKEALIVSPKRQQLYFILAVSHMYLQNYDEAVRVLEESLSQNDRVAETWWRLAGAQVEKGDKEAAKQTFLKAESRGIVFSGGAAGGLRKVVGLPADTSSTVK